MDSRIVGQLSPVDYDDDIFESEPYPIPYFDDKKLKISFWDARSQEYLDKADNVLQNFLSLTSNDRLLGASLVFNYYQEVLMFDLTRPLDLESEIDIWLFVYPNEITIDEDKNGIFYLCVSCGCEWEEEHGLQLVFKAGLKLTRASGHDGGFEDEIEE